MDEGNVQAVIELIVDSFVRFCTLDIVLFITGRLSTQGNLLFIC